MLTVQSIEGLEDFEDRPLFSTADHHADGEDTAKESHYHLPKDENRDDKESTNTSSTQSSSQKIKVRIPMYNQMEPPADLPWYEVVFQDIFLSGTMPKTQQYLLDRMSHPLFFFLLCVDVVLRGIAQVFLCNHPISGIFICIGMGWSSVEMMGYSILGTAIGTLAALVVATAPKNDILSGLCGYDGALVGCACWAFLDPSYNICANVLLSALSGVVHVACANILNAWHLPCFTMSFNIVTVFILIAIYNKIVSLNFKESTPVVHSEDFTDMSVQFVVDASLRGVGQFMFCDTTVGSAFVVAGIAISNRQGAFASVLGATVGWLMSLYVLKVSNVVAIRSGLYGYNCAGNCAFLAGAVSFKGFTLESTCVGIVGACLCSLYSVGMIGALSPLPVLTFPFITSTWFILVTRTKHLKKDDDSVDDMSLDNLFKRIILEKGSSNSSSNASSPKSSTSMSRLTCIVSTGGKKERQRVVQVHSTNDAQQV